MDTRPSTPYVTEKPVPVPRGRRVGGIILGGLMGTALGILGGFGAGAISWVIHSAQRPGAGLELLALLLGPIFIFPIVGLCTGLVTAAQRSPKRGALIGTVLFGGSLLVLSIPSITEFWLVVVALVVVAAVIGAIIGAISAGLSVALSTPGTVRGKAGK
jgi:hypothetical protein